MKSKLYLGLTDTFLLNNVLVRANNVGTPSLGAPDPTVVLPTNSRIALAGTTNGTDLNSTANTANIGVYGNAGKAGTGDPTPTYGVVGVTNDVTALALSATAGIYG